jgi:PKD repeat protein
MRARIATLLALSLALLSSMTAGAQLVYNGGKSGGLISVPGGQTVRFIPGQNPGPESLWISVYAGTCAAILTDGGGGQTGQDFILKAGDLLLFPTTTYYDLLFLDNGAQILFGGTVYNRPGVPICNTGLYGPSFLKVDRLLNLMTQSHASGTPRVQIWTWQQTTRKTSGNITYTLASEPVKLDGITPEACTGDDCCHPLLIGYALRNISGNAYTLFELDAAGAYNFDWNTAVPAPLTCQATASIGSGTAPVDVSFSASAAGGSTGYTYHWNFGDGKSADGPQVAHTYKSGGRFTWRMTVTDMGKQTCSKSAPIKILAPLTVKAAASPRQGASPLTATFTATAKGAKPPYAYLWDFGDGSTAVSATATHTFAVQGAYDCTVTVTDTKGTSAIAPTPVYVDQPIPPQVISAKALTGPPFALKLTGVDFQSGCSVTIDGVAVPEVQFKSNSALLLKGGSTLKAMVPKAVTVCILVTNPDGGTSGCFTYAR